MITKTVSPTVGDKAFLAVMSATTVVPPEPPATIPCSTVTANGGVVGNLTGNVTSSGTSTFADIDMSGTIDMGSNKITSVTNPTSAQDVATKNYVDTTTTANPIYVAVAGDAMTGALA